MTQTNDKFKQKENLTTYTKFLMYLRYIEIGLQAPKAIKIDTL